MTRGAHGGRGARVIAGDHHGADSSAARRSHRRGGARAWRVGEPDEAERHELALRIVVGADIEPLGHEQHTDALLAPRLRDLL
jgi:hypothetical protein